MTGKLKLVITYRFEVDTNGDMGNFLGGTETVDGATITFNPDWSIAGRAKQVDSNATALTQAQLDAIPDALETTLNDGLTYADAETYAWGTETTYYDSREPFLGSQVLIPGPMMMVQEILFPARIPTLTTLTGTILAQLV